MKIGVSVPLSAPKHEDIRSVGTDVSNAICLSQKYLGTDHELKIIDNGNSKPQMSNAIDQLADWGAEVVLGLPTSDEVFGSVAKLDNHQLPAITSMATSPRLAKLPNVFRTRPSDQYAVAVMVEHLKSANYGTVATITESHAYPGDCTRALIDLGTRSEISFCSEEFTSGEFSPELVEKLLESNPGAIFINTQSEYGFLEVLQSVRKTDPSLQVLGSAMPGARIVREEAGVLGDGIIYVSEPQLDEVITDYGSSLLETHADRFSTRDSQHPLTGDYSVLLTHAAFYAVDQLARAEVPVASGLRTGVFQDPAIGSFSFSEANEILASAVNQYRLMVLKEGIGCPLH